MKNRVFRKFGAIYRAAVLCILLSALTACALPYDDRDEEIVQEVLLFVGLEDFGQRSFAGLSEGEQQRVLLARALCKEPPVLILDKPANHLDNRQQMSLMEILLKGSQTTIIALHDLNLAAMYCEVGAGLIARYCPRRGGYFADFLQVQVVPPLNLSG